VVLATAAVILAKVEAAAEPTAAVLMLGLLTLAAAVVGALTQAPVVLAVLVLLFSVCLPPSILELLPALPLNLLAGRTQF
jgi:hypothetical protein